MFVSLDVKEVTEVKGVVVESHRPFLIKKGRHSCTNKKLGIHKFMLVVKRHKYLSGTVSSFSNARH